MVQNQVILKILGYVAVLVLVALMVTLAFAIGWQKGEKSIGDYYANHHDLCFEGDILLRDGKTYSCPTKTTWVEEPPIEGNLPVSGGAVVDSGISFAQVLADAMNKTRTVSGTVDTVYAGDYYGDIMYTNPDGTEENLPDPKHFPPPFHFNAKAMAGTVTIIPQESTINGQPQIVLKQGDCLDIRVVKGKYEAYRCEQNFKGVPLASDVR